MSDITQAIEIAVRTTGQQTITALNAELANNKAALAAMQAQLRSGAISTTEFIEKAAQLNQAIRTTEVQAKQAALALKGLPTTLGNLGPAALQAGYAIDDLQYGLTAIVNNMPGLVMALGGGTGLAGAIGIVAVAANLLSSHWGELRDLFGLGVPPKLIDDLADVEKELKALTAKEWKTAIDFRDIDLLNKKMEERNGLESAYQRLKSGKTKAEEKRSKAVTEAITESGGPEGVINTVAGLTPVTDSEQTAKQRARLAETQALVDAESEAQAKARGGSYTDEVAGRYADLMRSTRIKLRDANRADLKSLVATDTNNRDLGAKDLVTKASQGDEAARAQLQRLLEGNEEKFANRGIDTLRLGAGLQGAAPGNLFHEERSKAEDASAKKSAQALKARQEEFLRQQAVEDKAANDERAAKDKKDEEVRAAEDKAADNNRSADGRAERERKQADRAKAAADRAKAAAAKADQSAQTTAANKIDDGINPYLQAQFANNRLAQLQGGGVPEAMAKRQANAGVGRYLKANGQDPGLADEIVAKAFQDMNARYTQNQALTNNSVQSLIAIIAQAQAQAQQQQQAMMQNFLKIQGLGMNQDRARSRRPSGLMTLGSGNF